MSKFFTNATELDIWINETNKDYPGASIVGYSAVPRTSTKEVGRFGGAAIHNSSGGIWVTLSVPAYVYAPQDGVRMGGKSAGGMAPTYHMCNNCAGRGGCGG